MKLKTTLQHTTITNKDFDKESPYSKEPFSVTFTELSSHEVMIASIPYKDVDMDDIKNFKDVLALNTELFVKSVVAWENIQDENGKDLECDDKNKRAIFNVSSDFCNALMQKVSEKRKKLKKK